MTEYDSIRPLRVISLFSGYDAQLLSLRRLKRDYPQFDYVCVGWSEIDKYACTAHDALFPEDKGKNLGDVSRIDWDKAPDCDLLTYSFPCTSISSAGQQKGLAEGSGTASSLLWEVRKAIRAMHPRFLVMENVPSLLHDKFRPYLMEWLRFLEEEGYSNFTKVLGAQDFGVPQHRDRVFCVSVLGHDARYFFPRPFPLERKLRDVLEDDVDEGYYLSDERVQGLIKSTLKEKAAGRGFEFKPKTDADTANALTGLCAGRKTDNFLVLNR